MLDAGGCTNISQTHAYSLNGIMDSAMIGDTFLKYRPSFVSSSIPDSGETKRSNTSKCNLPGWLTWKESAHHRTCSTHRTS